MTKHIIPGILEGNLFCMRANTPYTIVVLYYYFLLYVIRTPVYFMMSEPGLVSRIVALPTRLLVSLLVGS
jgi:hypothetical protein